jgi:hypothetical protein
MNKMKLCWTYCDHCGEKIKVGDKCFYLANGDTFCTECVVLVDTLEEYKKRFDDCERSENGT